MPRLTLRRHLLALLGYGVLTIIVTYPAALRLSSHIPGGGDAPWFLWQLWWFKHAIVDLRQSPLVTDLLYYPLTQVPVNWQSPFNEIFGISLQGSIGLVASYNLLVLGGFVLSGYCMYLLTLRVIRRNDLAFVGGLIFAFSAYHGVRGLGHLSLATVQWLPLALLLLINFWQHPSPRRAVAAGVGTALAALASPYYLAYFLLPVGIVGATYVAVYRRTELRRPELWRNAAIMILVGGALAAPFYWDYLRSSPEQVDAAQKAAAGVSVYSADLASWLLPARENPIWQNVTRSFYRRFFSGNRAESTLFFGFLPPLLALGSLLLRPRRGQSSLRFWQALAVVGFLLSFGPVLHVLQKPVLGWMPYRLFMLLPGAYAFRAPSRVGITGILAAIILAMWVVKVVMEKRPAWPWRGLLTGWSILLLVNLSVGFPYPSTSARIPALYETIRSNPNPGALLELPSGEIYQDDTSWYMYFQTYHQRPIMSGYLGRRPERLQIPEQTLPFINRFFIQDWDSIFAGDWGKLVKWPDAAELLAGHWPDDIRNSPAILHDLGIRYVLLHNDLTRPGFFESAALLLSQSLGPPLSRDANTLLYAVPSVPPIRRGNPADLDQATITYDGAFSEPVIHRQSPSRMLDLRTGSGATATFTLPWSGTWQIRGATEGCRPAELGFTVDGRPVTPARTAITDLLQTFEITTELAAGEHSLRISPSAAAAAGEGAACAQPWLMNLTGQLSELKLPASSARLARFIGAEGDQVELLAAEIVSRPSNSSAKIEPKLLTVWRVDPSHKLTEPAGIHPTLYVHFEDAQGQRLAQADHVLAADSFWLRDADTDEVVFVDVTNLPEGEALAADARARIGLWYPDSQTYYWASESNRTTADGQLDLGTVEQLKSANR